MGKNKVRKKVALDLGQGECGELWQVAGEEVRALQTQEAQCRDNGNDLGSDVLPVR